MTHSFRPATAPTPSDIPGDRIYADDEESTMTPNREHPAYLKLRAALERAADAERLLRDAIMDMGGGAARSTQVLADQLAVIRMAGAGLAECGEHALIERYGVPWDGRVGG